MLPDLRFDDPDRLRVAIAGRTNSGKTSLVRTLLRSPVGEIADRANVTRWPEYYADDELGVIFVDCPGFQDAGSYRAYRIARERGNLELADEIRKDEDYTYEDRLVDAVSVCNLVIYVASLETVLEPSHSQELRLLRDKAPVVALVNKRRLARRALGEAAANDRFRQWTEMFTSAGIPWTDYDAHVAPPRALEGVHALVAAHVSAAQANRMHEYTLQLERRVATQRDRVASEFARCITEFRGTTLKATISRENYSEEKGNEVGRQTLLNAVGERLVALVGRCGEVYGYRPHVEQESLTIDAEIRKSLMEGSVGGAVVMALMGSNAGATVGGMLLMTAGGLAGLVLAGPAGAWALAEAGAAWGFGGGALLGALAGGKLGFTGDKEATVEITVDERILAAFTGLATAWTAAVAYQGFGKGEDVSADSMRELQVEVTAVLDRTPVRLASDSEDVIRQWMRQVLEALRI